MRLLLILCLSLLTSVPVFAHSWYPKACCSDQDCAPVTKMEPQPDGSIIVLDEMNRTILVPSNAQPKMSLDSKYHVCALTRHTGNPLSLDNAPAIENQSKYLFLCWFEPGGV